MTMVWVGQNAPPGVRYTEVFNQRKNEINALKKNNTRKYL